MNKISVTLTKEERSSVETWVTSASWKTFERVAGVAQAAASLFVWVSYLTVSQYHSAYSATAWVVLLGALAGLLAIGLTEAFELVELLWHRKLARRFRPVALQKLERAPMVSLHLPICNEPPAMVRETLEALAALDYPNLEVLVIDNNTSDPGLWKPVSDLCQVLGPRFKFHHLDKVEGFKAGALNLVLRLTDPAAEIVAVIDSDYVVRPDWLANLVPYSATSQAAQVILRAAPVNKTMPDGRVVPMWGFAQDTSFGSLNGVVTVPGPAIVILRTTRTCALSSTTAWQRGFPWSSPDCHHRQ